jgi:hypothetical protein
MMTSAAAPAIAPGSVLTVGSVIDPATLTRLSGEARFAEPSAYASAGNTGSAPPALPADPTAPVAADLALGAGAGLALPELPSLAQASAGSDENIDPIGDLVRGDGSDRTVVLTDADDTFLGGSGNEHVLGGGGADVLDGGAGNDWLEGGAGNDLLLGGAGNDQLDGGAGRDTLLGGAGNDLVQGGAGRDSVEGGIGEDVLVLDDVQDIVKELAAGSDLGGVDTLVVADSYARSLAAALPGLAPDGRATFVVGLPDPATFPAGLAAYRQHVDGDIENVRLEGAAGHDVVGDGDANRIEGNAGDNRLYGAGGDDWMLGGAGDDLLDGGQGADTLHGGAGDDVFVLGLHERPDTIFDHEGRNTLRLEGADPSLLQATMNGADLVLSHDGATVATLRDYQAESFAGIDLGDGLRPLADFQLDSGAADVAATTSDWLAEFLPAGAEAGSPALAEPWSLGSLDGTGDSAGMAGAGLPDLIAGSELWLPVEPGDGTAFVTGLDAPASEAPASSSAQPGEERELAA